MSSTVTNPFAGARNPWTPEPALPPAPPDPARTVKQIVDNLNRLMEERKARRDEWGRYLPKVLFAAGLPSDPDDRRTRQVFAALFEAFGGNMVGCVDSAAERLREMVSELGEKDDPRRGRWRELVVSIRVEQIKNDFEGRYDETPEERWARVRKWAEAQIKREPEAETPPPGGTR